MFSALDRQIRPIYDALDTGSNKSAILACNKLLKKNPNSGLIKALKALALVRMQKVEESLVLCDEVLASKPTDDSTLTAMMHVLRGLGRHTDTIKMFEEAFKIQPTNEDLGCQTFFSNARVGNWKAAQQLATKMQKQFKDDRYIFWNAMSAVLQARDSATPPPMRTILYKLAHRILTASPQLAYTTPDRFYLTLSVMRELELWEEADKLVTESAGPMIAKSSLVCDELRREIAKKRGMLKEEGERAKEKIVDKKDRNWLEFISVLDATFAGVGADASQEDTQARILDAKTLFAQVAESDGNSDRSGLLALVELEFRARKHGMSTDPKALNTVLEKYYTHVGDKACCFEDMRPYIPASGDELTQWTAFLEAQTHSTETIPECTRYINQQKLLRYSLPASSLTAEQETARASIYLKAYLSAISLGANLPETELRPGDDLALLAVHALVGAWKASGNEETLYSAVVLLEYALNKSMAAYQMRLILVRLYYLLNAPALALEHYRALRIKQVQNDTLSHFLLSRASTFSLAATGDLTLSTECIESSQIYVSNSQETSDMLIRAFTGEKYSQIPDFLEFEERLEQSLQRDIVKIEHVRMRIAHEPVNAELFDMELIELKFNFDRAHHDNRDREIIANYQPREQQSFEEQTRLFNSLPGLGWLWVHLKIYIRAFQQASDLDDTVEEKLLIGDRPKQSHDAAKEIPLKQRLTERKQEEIDELTPIESAYYDYCVALADWLEPHHNYVRPLPSEVLAEAARQSELKTGHPLKGIELPPAKNGSSNGQSSKKEEEQPPITPAPALATEFFDDMLAMFTESVGQKAYVEVLHIASIIQEALIILTVETHRFKPAGIVKMHRLGNLVQSIKEVRTKAVAAVKQVGTELGKLAEVVATQDSRKSFVDCCVVVLAFPEIDHDFALGVAKKVTDARKKVIEGVSQGANKIATTHAS